MMEFDRRALLAAAAGAALLPGFARAQADDPAVDPELRALFRGRSANAGEPTLAAFMQPARRSTRARILPAPAPQPEERMIPGPAGAPPVRVLVVRPQGASSARPALLSLRAGARGRGAALS